MRMDWLHKEHGGRVVLFFNGWGMDAGIVSELGTTSDVVMFYDYSTLELEQIPEFGEYREICIVAWSMGVWAASQVISRWNIQPVLSVALNGTERPVDDRFGIPCKIYALTERGMDELGRKKFVRRMFSEKGESRHLEEKGFQREIGNVCEELSYIRKQAEGVALSHQWDKVYVSEKDIIFPVENQLNWWRGKAPVTMLDKGHCPFACFKSWEEIIGISKIE